MTPQLKPHQLMVIDKIPDKFGLWLRPRVGKTPITIRLACAKVKKCLIIVPKHILEQWQEEIRKWNNTDCEFVLMTKERFRIDSIKEIKKRGRRKTIIFSDSIAKVDMVCVDEVHRQAANCTNYFYKCLQHYIDHNSVKYVYLLSGTPWTKDPWSIYSYGKLMGIAWEWITWRDKFFTPSYAGRRIYYKPNPDTFPRLVEILKRIGITIRLEDIVDLEEDYEQVEYFDLNTDQNKRTKLVCDTTPVARYVKLHQLEQAVLKSTGYDEGLSFECEKDKRILELAEEEDKLIIVCRYLDQIEKYHKALAKEGYDVYIIKGEMKEKVVDLCKKVNQLSKAIVIIQADKSDGYSLDSFSNMVFASMSYSFISWDQMKQRMKSMNKSKSCSYTYLLSRGKTVDQAIYNSIKAGEDFSDKVFNPNIY